MINFARLPIAERAPYFLEAANRRRLSPLFVEKDFWVGMNQRDIAVYLGMGTGSAVCRQLKSLKERMERDPDMVQRVKNIVSAIQREEKAGCAR